MRLPTSTALATLILIGGISIGGCTTFRDAHGQSALKPSLITFDCGGGNETALRADLDKAFPNDGPYCAASAELDGKTDTKEALLIIQAGGSGGDPLTIMQKNAGKWSSIDNGTIYAFINNGVYMGTTKTNGYSDILLKGTTKTLKAAYQAGKYQLAK